MARFNYQRITLVELFIGLTILGVVSLVLLSLCGGVLGIRVGTYSQGSRDGTVYKLSEKGMLVKTYEGEMAVKGYARSGGPDQITKSGQPGGNAWAFSVADEAVWQQLRDLPPDAEVRLHYTEYWMNGYADTDYLVTRVELKNMPD